MAPKKLTSQEFIDRARAVHGDRYGYAFSVYQGSHVKLMINCSEHGIFEQLPNNHLKGNGCPSCADESKAHTNESFIEKARKVHGDNYDYSKVVYRHSHIKVKIICKIHGVFEQKPNNHLYGKGCPDCADDSQRYTKESFIEKANSVHGDRYDYSKVVYRNSQTKVKMVCPEHGVFTQRPNKHLCGKGCPGCAKSCFDRTKSGFLYVLRSDCGQYMKIGITHNPKQRHTQLSKATPFSFKRIELIEGPGEQIANLEKELLAEYRPAEFTKTFDGYSEWRLWDDSIREKLTWSKESL